MTQTTVISLTENFHLWPLVTKFMKLRFSVFVKKMNWDLDSLNSVEFDLYDNPTCTYLIHHDGDHVLGGARLLRTNTVSSQGKDPFRYMIHDAYRGKLTHIPREICTDEPPADPDVWEMTRFASTGEAIIADKIIDFGITYLNQQRAKACLFLGSPAFMRFARKRGYPVTKLGPITGNQDGRFLAFRCDLRHEGDLAKDPHPTSPLDAATDTLLCTDCGNQVAKEFVTGLPNEYCGDCRLAYQRMYANS